MTTEEENENTVELTTPTPDQAVSFTRELTWEERFVGWIDAGMAGSPTVTLYRLEHAYNMLGADSTFDLDYGRLERWVGHTIGDLELAEKIRLAQETAAGEEDEDAALRERVVALLGLRLDQCREALGKGEADDDA